MQQHRSSYRTRRHRRLPAAGRLLVAILSWDVGAVRADAGAVAGRAWHRLVGSPLRAVFDLGRAVPEAHPAPSRVETADTRSGAHNLTHGVSQGPEVTAKIIRPPERSHHDQSGGFPRSYEEDRPLVSKPGLTLRGA